MRIFSALAVLVAAAVTAAAATAHPMQRAKRQVAAKTVTGIAPSAWRTWWGKASFAGPGVTLSSTVPRSPGETHSALITSSGTWANPTISFTTDTLRQLRQGSSPNPWEVGWVMFRFRDLSDYYYFILKPNGFELGKKQGSLDQVFLDTGSQPTLHIGTATQIRLVVRGARIQVYAGGALVLDYTDPSPLTGAGSVGLYEEDSRVRFTSLSIQ